MAQYCPKTGATQCFCRNKLARTQRGSAMLLDLKAALRNVFGDHTLYTDALIVASLPIAGQDADAWATRLLRNPEDIYNLIIDIVPRTTAEQIRD